MNQLTIEQQNIIGQEIAKILCLKKKRNGRYQTTWGEKTAIGIFNTIIRLSDDINAGTEIVA